MKKLIPLLLCILVLAGCAKTYDGPTTGREVLTEYTVDHFYAFFGEEETRYTNRTSFAYDIYGNRVQSMSYEDGELESKTLMTYDEDGNELTAVTWDYTGLFPKLDLRREHTYDDQGRILTSTSRSGLFGEKSWGRYTYDDENHSYTYENSYGDFITYYLDAEGRELRTVSHPGYETVYEYDEHGNRISSVSTLNGVTVGRFEARFDAQNRQIYHANFDENGRKIAEVHYEYDDEKNTLTIRRANSNIRIEYYRPDGTRYLIEDYDQEGNLSMRQSYTYREIQVPAKEE